MTTTASIEYLDLYAQMLAHQREHDGLLIRPFPGEPERPSWTCMGCLRDRRPIEGDPMRDLRRRFSFAVPNSAALDAITEHSPGGVVEIGAGGGYWAMLLQRRGVDVVAYDPQPPGVGDSDWHSGTAWTAVHLGDHTQTAEHPTRTLLLCWPSYDEPWPAQALEAFDGETVVYIGEGPGGCTADDRFHALLGEPSNCWHYDDDYNEPPCLDDCSANVTPLFSNIADVAIPQWAGIHDQLRVYRRRDGGTEVVTGTSNHERMRRWQSRPPSKAGLCWS